MTPIELKIPEGHGQALDLGPLAPGQAPAFAGPAALINAEGFRLRPDPDAPDDPSRVIVDALHGAGHSAPRGTILVPVRDGGRVVKHEFAVSLLTIADPRRQVTIRPGAIAPTPPGA